MPIIVQDFTWTQSLKAIHIRIPVKQVAHDNPDVFIADSYVKAHFSPYIFEVFLLHEVDSTKGKCIIKEDIITLDFPKKEGIEWETLEKELNKDEKKKLRQEILDKSIEAAKQEREDRRIKKTELDRFTVQQAMAIDAQQHELMDSRRDAERKQAMDSLEDWRKNTCQTNDMHGNKHAQEYPKSYPSETHSTGVRIVELHSSDEEIQSDKAKKYPGGKGTKQEVYKSASMTPKPPIKSKVKSVYVEKKKEEVAKRVLPKLRQGGDLEVTHTPRTFPTPSRESSASQEEAWLKNITLARRAIGFVSEDLRPEEQDPQWCKNKGDEFFKDGNFLGAISAYTHGILLSDKLPSLFANRSAAHFALGNFNKCLNDCSTALELMVPPCEGNRKGRAKCIVRRAAALARVGYLNKAIDEMKAAAKLLPDDEKIQKDIYEMERAWEQNPDSD